MNPKRLAALLLIAFTLLSLQSAALANAAEPPSFIIIVSNPPDGLELSIPSGAPGAEPYVLQKTVKGWESHYRYFYGGDPDSGSRKDELTVKYGDTQFTIPFAPAKGRYGVLYTLDVAGRTIAEGEKPLRTPLLIAMRVLLTLAIEGLVFYLFGYREKKELAGVLHREPRHPDRSEPALPRHFTGLYVGDRLLSAGNAYSRH